MNILEDFGLYSFRKMNRDTTQDFVKIKDIQDGIIITEDNRYINVIEIEPVNFRMLNAQEQSMLILDYNNWLKTAPTKFTIKCITTLTNIDEYIEETVKRLEKEPLKKSQRKIWKNK